MSKKIVFNIETNTDLEKVDKQINDIIGSTKSLKEQYRELRDAAAEATDPEDFDKLARAAGEIKDRIDDANMSIRAFASDTRGLDIVVGSVRGIAGAFAATQGAIALLAGENEDLNKILVKVQGSLAVLNGIQQVSQTLNKNSVVGLALYRAQQNLLNGSILGGSKALGTFRTALLATGIGAFVVLLGLLITNFEKVTEAIGLSKSELDKFNEEQNKLADDLESKLQKDIIKTTEEFNNLKNEIDLISDPISKLEKLIKKFGTDSAFAFLDPESPTLLADINRLLADQEKIINLTAQEQKAQEIIIENSNKLLELRAELKKVELDDDKKIKKELNDKIALLLKSTATQRDVINGVKGERIAIEENTRTYVKGEQEKQLANADTERKQIENIRRREQANKINEQNRIALIETRFQRELALLDAKFAEEKRISSKTGADIAVLEQRQERDRQLFIQNQQKALGDVILKAFKSVNDELKQLSLTTYREDEEAFLKSQETKAEELAKTLIETREEFIKVSEEAGGVSEEFLEELRKNNEALKATFTDVSKSAQALQKEYLEIEKVLRRNEQITQRRGDLIRLNAITNGLKFIINLEEKIADSNIIDGRQAIQNLKEQTGFAESLSKLKIILIQREAETRILEEQKVVEAISVAGDKIIFQQLQTEEGRLELKKKYGDDLTDTQRGLLQEIERISNSEVLSEAQKIQKLLELEDKFIQSGIEKRSNYFKKLNELKQQSLESEIRINEKFILEEEKFNEGRLADETTYLEQRKALLDAGFSNDRVSEGKRNDALLKLQTDFQLKTIKNEIALKEQKLKILEEEMKVNPNVNPKLFSEIQNEILELQNQSLTLTNSTLQTNLDTQKQIWENFTREIAFGTDNILGSVNQFISELGNESRNILNEVQKSNEKLLADGKITQKEFDKLQEDAFNANEARQEKLFYQQQQIELVRTLISGISSAQQAYQSQFLPVPDPTSPVRGGIAAGLAIAATGVRIAAIKKQKYQRAEFSGLSSAGGGGGRAFGGVSTSNVLQPTLRNDLDQSLRVFVLEGDITESQRRVRVVRGGANSTF